VVDRQQQWREFMGLGATYLQPVYPGEVSPETWAATVEAMQGRGSGDAPAMMRPESMIWTNLDEIWAPSSVHGAWAADLIAVVPDWSRRDVRIYPITGGRRVTLPGGPIEDIDDGGYVVEQAAYGTTVDGHPYHCFVTHLIFVEDGAVVRNRQYWSGPDARSNDINISTMANSRAKYRES
jgi:hypothetical protein